MWHICRMIKPDVKRVWCGFKRVQDKWGVRVPLQEHRGNRPGLGPVLFLCGPGSSRANVYSLNLCALPCWACPERAGHFDVPKASIKSGPSTNHGTWPGLTPPSEYRGYGGSEYLLQKHTEDHFGELTRKTQKFFSYVLKKQEINQKILIFIVNY